MYEEFVIWNILWMYDYGVVIKSLNFTNNLDVDDVSMRMTMMRERLIMCLSCNCLKLRQENCFFGFEKFVYTIVIKLNHYTLKNE